MSAVRVDFALVQPLVYPLADWVELRRRLALLLHEDGTLPQGLEGTVHRSRETLPHFREGLGGTASLADAFPRLLREARDFPCLVVPLEEPAGRLRREPSLWPAGMEVDASASCLVLPRGGDVFALHLAAGVVDPDALGPSEGGPSGGMQHRAREAFLSALGEPGLGVYPAMGKVVGSVLGGTEGPAVHDVVEPSGGHLLTLAHGADPALVEALRRVHAVQEGTARDESALLLPDEPAGTGWAHFGWSYTSVATAHRATAFRLLFPVVGVNLSWYRYRKLRSDLIDLSRSIHALDTDRELVAQTEFYNEAILDVKVWEAEREAFERGLRPVYRSVHDRLWDYWDTDESRETVHEGIDYLRDFLDRKYSVRIATRENTQSRILFVIAIFQLLSVFGLISGYLYFWEKTPLPDAALYESELMVWATLLSPVVVLVLIAWLLWDFFRRHR